MKFVGIYGGGYVGGGNEVCRYGAGYVGARRGNEVCKYGVGMWKRD